MEAIDCATLIVQRLTHAGYTAYFAGGWVRDHLMGIPSSDIDIATDAPPEKILDLFSQTILVGLSFGVVVVCLDGHQFEVATFRKDCGYSDGRKPDKIEFSDAREDAIRRDFTINGMFYDPIEKVVHDFVGGKGDLKEKIIKAIGDPYERFAEDRLRMIRAVRFACRFSFRLDEETREAIVANAETLFPAVSVERIWAELNKMAAAPRFDQALLDMHRLGLLSVIFPQLVGLPLHEIKARVAHFSVLPKETPTILFMQELFPKSSLESLMDIFKGLHVSNEDLKWLESQRQAQSIFAESKGNNLVELTRFYAHKHSPLLILFEAAKRSDSAAFIEKHKNMQHQLTKHIERLVHRQPVVTAAHLKAKGVAPGVEMGRLLKLAEEIAITQDLDDPEKILKLIQNKESS